MKGKTSFHGYTDKGLRNAKRAEAGRANLKAIRHDWNVRAVPVQPSRLHEVYVYDGELVHACAWLPRAGQTVLDANLIPQFINQEAALLAYAQAKRPDEYFLTNRLHRDLKGVSYLHLLRLAPGVDYGTVAPEQSELELGPDGSD